MVNSPQTGPILPGLKTCSREPRERGSVGYMCYKPCYSALELALSITNLCRRFLGGWLRGTGAAGVLSLAIGCPRVANEA
jgi:hypothetical protein